MKHSLRLRLTLACLALLATGLIGVGVVSYRLVESSLVSRVDQQLAEGVPGMLRYVARVQREGPGPQTPNPFQNTGPDFLRNSLVVTALTPAGQVAFTTPSNLSVKDLPKNLPGSTANPSLSHRRSFDITIGSHSYRALAVAWQLRPGTGPIVLAQPLHEVNSTLDEILVVELILGGIALAGVGAGTWLLVRRGLRPLERMAETATAIAGGDLSRRVEEDDRTSEVGRLGVAFNVMLTQIEGEIAERRASEERLRRFAADASHELRTPLTSIRGYAELFRRGAADRPEDLALTMQRIESEATRMTSLVDDLLLLARLDRRRPLVRERVEIGQLVLDVVASQRVVHPDREYRLDIHDVALLGDEARLRQVLLNLLANAANHTPAGTPIDLSTRWENGEVVIEVADHGDGLSKEDVARVFERFFRVDAARFRGDGGGSGLGLAIVAAIVEAHGGRVEVDSTPGNGARFRVCLPGTEPVRAPTQRSEPIAPVEA
ncbi:MAG: HAMP domain-containing sensor histidine kinase [Gaiellales bacterium]